MYNFFMYAHLATVIPCVVLGPIAFILRKNTKAHKIVGRLYCFLMVSTAMFALFLPAHVGPRIFNHFGWIHSFCLLTFYSVTTAILAIRKGQVKKHKRKLIHLYIGAILIAGSFTFYPGRFMHQLLFN